MASKNNLIKPPVVLAVVCACCCGLLAVANSVTKIKLQPQKLPLFRKAYSSCRTLEISPKFPIFSQQTMKKQLQPLSMSMKTSRLLFW